MNHIVTNKSLTPLDSIKPATMNQVTLTSGQVIETGITYSTPSGGTYVVNSIRKFYRTFPAMAMMAELAGTNDDGSPFTLQFEVQA